MSLSRRKTLALLGGGLVAAATTSGAAFVTTRTPTKALAPWDAAGTYTDPRKNALSYALLAPNPHNRQPWEAELVGTDRLTLYRDPARDLPVTDPVARQLTIGMGCFLDLMEMAAAAQGYSVTTTLFPEGDTGPVATCHFAPAPPASNPLFAHVFDRRSHKEAFGSTPVSDTATLTPYARLFTSGPQRDQLKRIAHDAWQIEATTPAAWQESVDLLRIGKAEINANPDGIDIGGPMMEALALAGVFSRDAASDLSNPGTQGAIADTAQAIASAPAMVLSTTPGNTRRDQIAAGRDWLRLNLATTAAGLAVRPVSQALQEYPEMAAIYDEVHRDFAAPGETVQMLGLLGYAPRTPRTPRWPLETRLRNA